MIVRHLRVGGEFPGTLRFAACALLHAVRYMVSSRQLAKKHKVCFSGTVGFIAPVMPGDAGGLVDMPDSIFQWRFWFFLKGMVTAFAWLKQNGTHTKVAQVLFYRERVLYNATTPTKSGWKFSSGSATAANGEVFQAPEYQLFSLLLCSTQPVRSHRASCAHHNGNRVGGKGLIYYL